MPCTNCHCGPKTISFPISNAIPADVLAKAKLLVLNYPNSPTGKIATRAFYERWSISLRQHQLVVIQDAAHILLTFDGEPLSFLSVPGAKDVGVEVHSTVKRVQHDRLATRMGMRE